MTNPPWFQNLPFASFLSLTGQCKPFDAKADGCYRGEGVAAVFLKKLSAVRADGEKYSVSYLQQACSKTILHSNFCAKCLISLRYFSKCYHQIRSEARKNLRRRSSL